MYKNVFELVNLSNSFYILCSCFYVCKWWKIAPKSVTGYLLIQYNLITELRDRWLQTSETGTM